MPSQYVCSSTMHGSKQKFSRQKNTADLYYTSRTTEYNNNQNSETENSRVSISTQLAPRLRRLLRKGVLRRSSQLGPSELRRRVVLTLLSFGHNCRGKIEAVFGKHSFSYADTLIGILCIQLSAVIKK